MISENMIHREIAGYRLTEHIGSGGMGDVYKAYHAVLGRTAAVKILHQKEFANRFRNEAYIQSGVNHPNIARLYESVLTGDYPCIIMEYVEGKTLEEHIRKKGKLLNEETTQIVAQIASSLLYLHQKEILHRDIKPANFKLQSDGVIKMLDFGIAKDKYSPKFTQEGYLVGTTEYMAPEQFEQKPEMKSDIWSLGVMTYEMLTGYMPFESNNPLALRTKILKASFTDPKILVPEISVQLQAIVEKMLRVNPAQRISSEQLSRVLKGQSKQNRETPFSFLSSLSMPKFPSLKISGLLGAGTFLYAGLAVLLIVLIILFVTNNTPPPHPNNEKKPTEEEIVDKQKVKINVSSIENAYIVLPDGTKQTVPYEISGKNGQEVEFTVGANGYEDKKVIIQISNRRSSYDINLEKIKQ
ncbi:MAG: serine/threonine-protein kinase [Chitinophagaceae bacterium]